MKNSILINGMLISCFAASATNLAFGQQSATETIVKPNDFSVSDRDKEVLSLRIKYILVTCKTLAPVR